MNEAVSSRAPEGWSAYSDPAYGFRLHVPDGYVVRRQDVAGLHGLKVGQSLTIAPGCSLHALRGEHVYQLTAMCAEGEAMAGNFRLVP